MMTTVPTKAVLLGAGALGVGASIGAWKASWHVQHRAEHADYVDPANHRPGTYGPVPVGRRQLRASGIEAGIGVVGALTGSALLGRSASGSSSLALVGATILGASIGTLAAGTLGALSVYAGRHLEFAP